MVKHRARPPILPSYARWPCLIDAVYARAYSGGPLPGVDHITREHFSRVLEEIALVAWHSDSRTASTLEIRSHCEAHGLTELLKPFEKYARSSEAGVTTLLTAFYFRRSGKTESGDPTFEFTHKSFAEYLTARRLCRAIARIAQARKDHIETVGERGWIEKDATAFWMGIAHRGGCDEDLEQYLRREIIGMPRKKVAAWASVCAECLRYLMLHGPPNWVNVERPDDFVKGDDLLRASDTLLTIYAICADMIGKVFPLHLKDDRQLGAWLLSLQARCQKEDAAYLRRLRYFDFCGANLDDLSLRGANLVNSDFTACSLRYSDLSSTDLEGAMFKTATLTNTDLSFANLSGADFSGANLTGATFLGATLDDAKLDGAKLRGADLRNCSILESQWRDAGFEENPSQADFILGHRVELLNLSVRANNCLEAARVGTIMELVKRTESDLLRVRSMGKTSVMEIKRKLAEFGLELGAG